MNIQQGYYSAANQKLRKEAEKLVAETELTEEKKREIKHLIALRWTQLGVNAIEKTSSEIREGCMVGYLFVKAKRSLTPLLRIIGTKCIDVSFFLLHLPHECTLSYVRHPECTPLSWLYSQVLRVILAIVWPLRSGSRSLYGVY